MFLLLLLEASCLSWPVWEETKAQHAECLKAHVTVKVHLLSKKTKQKRKKISSLNPSTCLHFRSPPHTPPSYLFLIPPRLKNVWCSRLFFSSLFFSHSLSFFNFLMFILIPGNDHCYKASFWCGDSTEHFSQKHRRKNPAPTQRSPPPPPQPPRGSGSQPMSILARPLALVLLWNVRADSWVSPFWTVILRNSRI